jgi:hypothetical protein
MTESKCVRATNLIEAYNMMGTLQRIIDGNEGETIVFAETIRRAQPD